MWSVNILPSVKMTEGSSLYFKSVQKVIGRIYPQFFHKPLGGDAVGAVKAAQRQQLIYISVYHIHLF